MIINSKFKKIRELKNLTQEEFAAEFGITRASLSQIEGDRNKPTIELIEKVAIKYSIDANLLLFESIGIDEFTHKVKHIENDTSVFNTPQKNPVLYKEKKMIGLAAEPAPKYTIQNSKLGIPLIPIDALAGMGSGDFTISDVEIEDRYVIPEFEKADFLIRVKGNSMYPKYYPGDLLGCRRVQSKHLIEWNKAYVIDTLEGILVKRILKGETPEMWTLRSDNKEYQDMDVSPKTDVRNINKIIGVVRMES